MYEVRKKFSVLCLVGGFGTRVKHILKNIPKPLAPIKGKPFLYWLIEDLKKFGANEIFLLTHFRPEAFRNFADLISDRSCKVTCIEEKTPEGTGGAILSAIVSGRIQTSRVIILNGDTFIKMNYWQILNRLEKDCDLVLSGKYVENTSRYGALKIGKNSMLISISEKSTNGPGLVNAGVLAANVDFLKKFNEKKRPLSLETDLIPSLLAYGTKIGVDEVSGSFLDIGTEKTLSEAEEFIEAVIK